MVAAWLFECRAPPPLHRLGSIGAAQNLVHVANAIGALGLLYSPADSGVAAPICVRETHCSCILRAATDWPTQITRAGGRSVELVGLGAEENDRADSRQRS